MFDYENVPAEPFAEAELLGGEQQLADDWVSWPGRRDKSEQGETGVGLGEEGCRVFADLAETRAYVMANLHERQVFTRNPDGDGYIIKRLHDTEES